MKPLIGIRFVEKLSIADLERFQADIKDGKTAKDRGGRGGITSGGAGVAGRTVGMLHTIFEQAARWKVIEANPARGVHKISMDVKRDRRLSVDELICFGKALNLQEAESPLAVAAIRLILLTGRPWKPWASNGPGSMMSRDASGSPTRKRGRRLVRSALLR